MKLQIIYLHKLNRPYLIKRVGGAYEQHAHMRTRKDAEKIRHLIDSNRYPYCKDYKVAMQRLLTEEEFKKLKKKHRYINVNKGVMRC